MALQRLQNPPTDEQAKPETDARHDTRLAGEKAAVEVAVSEEDQAEPADGPAAKRVDDTRREGLTTAPDGEAQVQNSQRKFAALDESNQTAVSEDGPRNRKMTNAYDGAKSPQLPAEQTMQDSAEPARVPGLKGQGAEASMSSEPSQKSPERITATGLSASGSETQTGLNDIQLAALARTDLATSAQERSLTARQSVGVRSVGQSAQNEASPSARNGDAPSAASGAGERLAPAHVRADAVFAASVSSPAARISDAAFGDATTTAPISGRKPTTPTEAMRQDQRVPVSAEQQIGHIVPASGQAAMPKSTNGQPSGTPHGAQANPAAQREVANVPGSDPDLPVSKGATVSHQNSASVSALAAPEVGGNVSRGDPASQSRGVSQPELGIKTTREKTVRETQATQPQSGKSNGQTAIPLASHNLGPEIAKVARKTATLPMPEGATPVPARIVPSTQSTLPSTAEKSSIPHVNTSAEVVATSPATIESREYKNAPHLTVNKAGTGPLPEADTQTNPRLPLPTTDSRLQVFSDRQEPQRPAAFSDQPLERAGSEPRRHDVLPPQATRPLPPGNNRMDSLKVDLHAEAGSNHDPQVSPPGKGIHGLTETAATTSMTATQQQSLASPREGGRQIRADRRKLAGDDLAVQRAPVTDTSTSRAAIGYGPVTATQSFQRATNLQTSSAVQSLGGVASGGGMKDDIRPEFALSDSIAESIRTAHTPSAPPPLIPRQDLPAVVARQLAEAAAVRQGSGPIDIVLSPEELGRVRLSVSASEVGVSVSILAERAETLDMMRRNIDDLGREFRAMGYEDVTFAFSQGGSDGAQAEQETRNGGSMTPQQSGLVLEDLAGTPTITLDPVAVTGLDLRL